MNRLSPSAPPRPSIPHRRRLLVILSALAVLGWLMPPATAAPDPEPYQSKGKRDPFVSLVWNGRLVSGAAGGMSIGEASTLVLAGVVWDPGGHSLALINDTEVKVGDTIGPYQVTDIQQNAVTLVRDGKPVVLQIAFDETSGARPSRSRSTGGKRR